MPDVLALFRGERSLSQLPDQAPPTAATAPPTPPSTGGGAPPTTSAATATIAPADDAPARASSTASSPTRPGPADRYDRPGPHRRQAGSRRVVRAAGMSLGPLIVATRAPTAAAICRASTSSPAGASTTSSSSEAAAAATSPGSVAAAVREQDGDPATDVHAAQLPRRLDERGGDVGRAMPTKGEHIVDDVGRPVGGRRPAPSPRPPCGRRRARPTHAGHAARRAAAASALAASGPPLIEPLRSTTRHTAVSGLDHERDTQPLDVETETGAGLDDRLDAGVDVEITGVGLVGPAHDPTDPPPAHRAGAGDVDDHTCRQPAGEDAQALVGGGREVGEQSQGRRRGRRRSARRTPPRRARPTSGDTWSNPTVAAQIAPCRGPPAGVRRSPRSASAASSTVGGAPAGASLFPPRRPSHPLAGAVIGTPNAVVPQLGDDALGRAARSVAQPHPAGQRDERGVEAERRIGGGDTAERGEGRHDGGDVERAAHRGSDPQVGMACASPRTTPTTFASQRGVDAVDCTGARCRTPRRRSGSRRPAGTRGRRSRRRSAPCRPRRTGSSRRRGGSPASPRSGPGGARAARARSSP